MRQDALHRPHAEPARAHAADRHAHEQLCFDFRDDDAAPITLGRIGPRTIHPSVDWHERGIAHELAGDLRAAIESYGRALRVAGPDAQIAFDLAHALAEVGERDRAIERYRQVIEIDASRADAWSNLGDLLIDAGDSVAAIDSFRHALDVAPDDADVHYNVACALDEVGDSANGRTHFRAFVRLADGQAARVAYARDWLDATSRLDERHA